MPPTPNQPRSTSGRPAGSARRPELPGGRYTLDAELGAGPLGRVFRAKQKDLERVVACKVFDRAACGGQEGLARLKERALAAARLNHEALVKVHDVDVAGATPYLVMDLVEGAHLRRAMQGGERPTAKALLQALAQVADALQEAHEAGLVHGDLRPENVFLDKDGAPRVTDLGLAAAVSLPRLLSPDFAAPEQRGEAAGTVGPAADVYGLASLALDALGDAAGALPKDVAAALGRCRSPRPEDRAPNIQVVSELLREAADALPPNLRPAAKPASARGSSALRRSAVVVNVAPAGPPSPLPRYAAAGALCATLLLLLALWLRPGGSAPAAADLDNLELPQVGARGAVVCWRSQVRQAAAEARLTPRGGSAAPVSLRLLQAPGEQDPPPYACTALLTGLEPATSYELALAQPGGGFGLPRPFTTVARAEFEPVRRLRPTTDGGVELVLDAKIPFTARFSPQPDAQEPPRTGGQPVFARRHVATWKYATLAGGSAVEAPLRSVDGDEAKVEFDARRQLAADLERVFASFLKDRTSAAWYACLDGSARDVGKLLRGAFKERRALEDKEAATPAALAGIDQRTWASIRSRISQTTWYETLEPLLPGLPGLLKGPLSDEALRGAAERALVPPSLVSRAAAWSNVGQNPDWRAVLAPGARPLGLSYGKPLFQGTGVVERAFDAVQLVHRATTLMFDKQHPKFKGLFDNPLVADVMGPQTLQCFLPSYDPSAVGGAELELSLRTARLPAVVVVELNNGRYVAVYEDRPADVDEFEAWRRDSGANVREMNVVMRTDLEKKEKLDLWLKAIEEGMPEAPRKISRAIPPSALVAGTNRAFVYQAAAPVDQLEFVGLVGLTLRLKPGGSR